MRKVNVTMPATGIKVNKRTFGKISGSFVDIQKNDGKTSQAQQRIEKVIQSYG